MKFTVEQLKEHLNNGGQVWRLVGRDKFFYKIEDGQFMCRVNERGGWHNSISPIEKVIRDDLNVALDDWDAGWDQKVFTTKLPELKQLTCPDCDSTEVDTSFVCWKCNAPVVVCLQCRTILKGCACGGCELGRTLIEESDMDDEQTETFR